MLLSTRDVVGRVGHGVMTATGFPVPAVTDQYGKWWREEDIERWRKANWPAPVHRKRTRPLLDLGAVTRPAE